MAFQNKAEATKAGWFSRRHVDGTAAREHLQHVERRRDDKKAAAAERAIERAQRSDEQQLKRLDRMFGAGQGANKERARLAKRILDQRNAPKEQPPKVTETSKMSPPKKRSKETRRG